MTENQKNAANECFKHDSNLASVFVTDDAQCFTVKNWAQLHANESKLSDKTILLINRNFNDLKVVDKFGITVELSDEGMKELSDEGMKELSDEGKAETPDQVIDKRLNAMNKTELQARATELQIEFTDDNTKAELIALIEDLEEKK